MMRMDIEFHFLWCNRLPQENTDAIGLFRNHKIVIG
jgi:hypothetical protein